MSSHGKDIGSDEVRVQLRQVFEGQSLDQHGNRWERLWEKGELLPWDRGFPSPALVDTLKNKQDKLQSGKPRSDGKRKKALVPGCGRGYDVLLLASYGYHAVGLDISETAIKECKAFAAKEAPKYLESATDPGSYEFVAADFFSDEWLDGVGAAQTGFDIVYDYTFLCALPPEARPSWASRQSQLLSEDADAKLICLEFPMFKDPSTGGPPFGMRPETYVAHLSRPGEKLPYTEQGYPTPPSGSNDAALQRVDHWQPERTHAVGQGSDWVSIWKHM